MVLGALFFVVVDETVLPDIVVCGTEALKICSSAHVSHHVLCNQLTLYGCYPDYNNSQDNRIGHDCIIIQSIDHTHPHAHAQSLK